MAIPSSSSIVAPLKHGVFLSFRGPDTRDTFVSHLYEALRLQGIPTFLDNEDFQKGSEIFKLFDEIQKSNVSVVILSTNYADSPFCLKELVKIMECRKTQKQQVVPIFYHVHPSDVQNQTGSYGVAFKNHQAYKEYTAETLQSWRNALSEVAKLAGREVKDKSSEAQAIKDIVNDISKILQPLYSNDFQGLVSIQQRIQQVESLLCIRRRDIRVIGIWGMGGLGKTTLANALFNKYKYHFDGSCFLKHVRERSKSSGGLNQLEQDLVFEIFNGQKYISTDKMLNQLHHKKVLVVLDDVDNSQQFDEIIGNPKRYGPGSRIIITSRDKQVLRNVGSHEWIYEIPALEENESLQLFKLYALKEDCEEQWHSELSKEFVNYVKGNPLGLKILGRHVQGKGEQEWRSALYKISEGLDQELTKVFKISLEGLDFHELQIFLDIACFFNRYPTSEVWRFLHGCYGSSLNACLRNLEDKALVTMSSPDVDMHDLLEEMGKEIVREESRKEPGKRSRLWNHEDIEEVLTNDTGSAAVEGISMISYQKRLKLAPTAFMKMPKLKLLKFRCELVVELPGGLKFLPKDELRHFEWHFYPLRSLPSYFIPQKLVTLDMSDSEVEQLWNGVWKFPNLHKIIMNGSKIKRLWQGVQDMPNLKIMDLGWCMNMIEMPDLSKAPKLEELYCPGCAKLEEVSASISHLSSLKKLNFQYCKKIRSFPSIATMMHLSELSLRNCSSLRIFPEVSRNIKSLDLCAVGIEEIPQETFRALSGLKELYLGSNKRLGSLPNSLGCLFSLQLLDVSWSIIESLPTSIVQLSQLQVLNITGCKRLRHLPELPSSVCKLMADGCESLQNVSFSPGLTPYEVLERCKVDFRVQNFSFAGCFKLNKRAREKIFAFAQRSITSVVAPTLNKWMEGNSNPRWGFAWSRFAVPGNEMPAWIEHRSGGGEGSTITIEFQPSNLLGFIFCTVFHFDGEYEPIVDGVSLVFEVQVNSNHSGSRRKSRSMDWMIIRREQSQHVLVCYFPYPPDEANSQYSELSATVEVITGERAEGFNVVGKWGFSLIYKDGDEEEYRYHKGPNGDGNDEVKSGLSLIYKDGDYEEQHTKYKTKGKTMLTKRTPMGMRSIEPARIEKVTVLKPDCRIGSLKGRMRHSVGKEKRVLKMGVLRTQALSHLCLLI